jgi:NTE family protein
MHREPTAPAARLSLFDGVPPDELAELLAGLERRRFGAGDVVMAEGEMSPNVFLIESGAAEVYVNDRHGVEHLVGRIGPGTTIGEVALLTGQPGAATVRATSDLEVLVMSDAEFDAVASRFPRVYRNVGAILAERLERTDRLAAEGQSGRLALLRDGAAPPELPWALACSVAWHTRAPTLLLVTGRDPHDDLAALAAACGGPRAEHASLRVFPSRDVSLAEEVDELFLEYESILVLADGAGAETLATAREVHLTRAGEGAPGARPDGTLVEAWVPGPARLGPDRDGVVRIPPLEDADVEALRSGTLPGRTAAGRSLGWVARDLAGLKVGLALGAGSLRGYAHVGVIRAFDRAGLSADYVAGTSIGAAVAALHAAGWDPDGVAAILDRTGPNLFRPTLSRSGLLSNRALKRFLKSVVHDRRIEELGVPLALVSADLPSQTEVIFRRGPIWLAVLASITIPGVYPALRIGSHTLVDGGILNPVPSSVAAEMGADVVVAVRLAPQPLEIVGEMELMETGLPSPSALSVLLHAFEVMQARIVSDLPDVTTFTISPHLEGLPGAKLRHFVEGRRFIESGEAAAEEALPRLATVLPWLR